MPQFIVTKNTTENFAIDCDDPRKAEELVRNNEGELMSLNTQYTTRPKPAETTAAVSTAASPAQSVVGPQGMRVIGGGAKRIGFPAVQHLATPTPAPKKTRATKKK